MRYKLFIFALLIFILISAVSVVNLNHIAEHSNGSGEFGITEVMMFAFKANEPFNPNSYMAINIHMPWFVFNAIIVSLTGAYAGSELKGSSSIITRIRTKKIWWSSKFIILALSVVSLYVLFLIAVLIVSLCSGRISGEVNYALLYEALSVDVSGISGVRLLMITLLFPLMLSIAISELQLLIALKIKPILSVVIMLCLMLAGACYRIPWLLFNFTMTTRTAYWYKNDIPSIWVGIVAIIGLTSFAYIMGRVLIKKIDIW